MLIASHQNHLQADGTVKIIPEVLQPYMGGLKVMVPDRRAEELQFSARDFMINKGFTYVIPPFMMHGNVVQGVMSFPEMDAMMYKIG